MEPTVTWDNDQYALRAKVYPFGTEDQGWRTWIDVRRDNLFCGNGGWQSSAEINWPALGARGASDVVDFAGGLMRAVAVAHEMDMPIHMYRVEVELMLASTGEKTLHLRNVAGTFVEQVRQSVFEGVTSEGNVIRVLSIEEVTDAKTEAGS